MDERPTPDLSIKFEIFESRNLEIPYFSIVSGSYSLFSYPLLQTLRDIYDVFRPPPFSSHKSRNSRR